ncbi:MAG TPA: AI-2E family transporter, partial [Ktedonobacterales bacterium]
MRSDPTDERPALAPTAAVASPASDTPSRRLTVSLSQRTLWLAAGVALVALVAVIALTRALGAVLLIFLAITLAEAVRPLVARLERIRIPRPLGALLIYLVVAGLVFGLGWLLFTPLAAQINELISNLPTYLAQAQQWANDAQQALAANDPLRALVNALAAQLTVSLQAALPALLQFPLTLLSGVFGGLLSVVIVITMSIFWLMSAGKL